jgi:electron transfer flavoprotein alpha subunit
MEGFAANLAIPFDLVVLESESELVSEAETAYVVDASSTPPDVVANALAELAKGYTKIAAVSSMVSKDLLPRIAAKLDAAMITDVISMESPQVFKRSMYAGSVIATVQSSADQLILTVRPSGFPQKSSTHCPTIKPLAIEGHSRATILASRRSSKGRPDLTQAKLIISGGRPLKDAETFERVIGGFADAFGGAVGATRAAVDAGIAPNECQVGQTGKIVAPALYVAAGISGSTQHMAGIKDSKLIVAINKDPDAPIFSVADFGIVGDLFDVLPQLQLLLKSQLGAGGD